MTKNSRLTKQHFHPKHWPLWILFGVMWLISWLPYPLLMRLGQGLGLLSMKLLSSRRKVVKANLNACFPEKSEAEREVLLRENFKRTGMAIAESMMAWWWPDWRVRSRTRVIGLENLSKALETHNGVIMLTCHMLNLEMAGRAIGLEWPSTGFYRPDKNPVYDFMQYQGRMRSNINLISKNDIRRMIRALRQGERIFYLPDQDPGPVASVFVPFLGVEHTATTTGTTKLAKMSGCAIVPLKIYLDEHGVYTVEMHQHWDNFPSGDDHQDAKAINTWFEQVVSERPEQYMWVHRRFKTRPEGAESIY